jgi:plastocyanin
MARRAVAVAGICAFAIILSAPVSGASGGGACPPPITNGSETRATIKNFCYEPTAIHIRPGATVTWLNKDPVPHTVTGANRAWGSFKSLKRNRSLSFQFNRAGVYPYYCVLHVGMVGTVVVRDGRLPEPLSGKEASEAVRRVRMEDATAASATLPAAPDDAKRTLGWVPIVAAALVVGSAGIVAGRARGAASGR